MTQSEQDLPAPGPPSTFTSGHIARHGATRAWLAAILFLHVWPLLTASTNFTLFTFVQDHRAFNWSYANLRYSDGWGYVYHSPYSGPQILAYLIAYASGIILYAKLTRPRWLATLAAGLCVMGLISFVIEGSHLVFEHNLSLIASFPIVLLPIAIWTAWRTVRSG